MKLKDIKKVFNPILPKAVFRYVAREKPDKYIVWAEEAPGDTIHAGNKTVVRVIEGTVDLFTRTEYDPIAKQIEEAMENADMGWYLNSSQYEEETKYIHYEWVWSVGNGEI